MLRSATACGLPSLWPSRSRSIASSIETFSSGDSVA
jgi:hypothetical protein